MEFGDFLGDQAHVGRFVALAAMGVGGEEGRVGFQYEGFQGQGGYHATACFRVFERQGAADAQFEAQGNGLLAFVEGAAERVPYAGARG